MGMHRAITGSENQAWRAYEVARIDEFLKDPAKFVPAKPVPAPPGMPIGEDIAGPSLQEGAVRHCCGGCGAG